MFKLSTLKVGIITLIAITGVIYVLLFLKEIPFLKEEGYTFKVIFKNIGGMMPGTSATLAGVRIGKVKEVSLDKDGNAVVVVYIEKRYKIPEKSIFSIGFEGIVGQKVLNITPHKDFKEGDWIKEGDVINNSVAPIELEDIAAKVKDALDEVRMLLGTLRRTISEEDLKKNIMEATEYIAKATEEAYGFTKVLKEIGINRKEDIDVTIKKIREITENIALTSKKLDTTVNSVNDMIGDKILQSDVKEIISNIKSSSEKLDKITDEIKNLITDEQMQNDVKSIIQDGKNLVKNSELTVSAINKAVKTINELEVEPSFEFRYIPKTDIYQADMDIRLYPPDKKIFYLIGLDDVGEASKTNLQLGVFYQREMWLRFGFKKGKLGAGFNKYSNKAVFLGDIIDPNELKINLRFGKMVDPNRFILLGLENIFDDNFVSLGILQKY